MELSNFVAVTEKLFFVMLYHGFKDWNNNNIWYPEN
jgi:hypothetical protein